MISLSNVSKKYENRKKTVHVDAIKNITLTISDGEIVAITGKSGSGKSTLLNMIGAVRLPDVGAVTIDGKNLNRMNSDELSVFRNEQLGFVFQSFLLEPSLTALQNVELPLLIAGEKKEIREKKAADMLKKVGLTDRMFHKPSELSGGEKQRVGIARALVNCPKIILADEPTGNLDQKTGREIFELLRTYSQGKTFIYVTHDSELAEAADRRIVLSDGTVASDSSKTGSENNDM